MLRQQRTFTAQSSAAVPDQQQSHAQQASLPAALLLKAYDRSLQRLLRLRLAQLL
jgi:hypothetical protein